MVLVKQGPINSLLGAAIFLISFSALSGEAKAGAPSVLARPTLSSDFSVPNSQLPLMAPINFGGPIVAPHLSKKGGFPMPSGAQWLSAIVAASLVYVGEQSGAKARYFQQKIVQAKTEPEMLHNQEQYDKLTAARISLDVMALLVILKGGHHYKKVVIPYRRGEG